MTKIQAKRTAPAPTARPRRASRAIRPSLAATALFATALACGPVAGDAGARITGDAREPIVGGPCEGCEWVFADRPETIGARARIAPEDAEGERLVVAGTVSDRSGAAHAGIVVYAYQTDAGGIYPRHPEGVRHGRYRGWAVSDESGRFTFDTIRPGGYPGTGIPQHIHLHVIEPGRCTYYLGDLLFDDDPRLGARDRARAATARGGSGLATPTRDLDGAWHVRRDIVLGLGIPDYERCAGAK